MPRSAYCRIEELDPFEVEERGQEVISEALLEGMNTKHWQSARWADR